MPHYVSNSVTVCEGASAAHRRRSTVASSFGISYATTPNAQISTFVLHLFVSTSSGEKYAGVPQNVLAIASDPGRTIDSPRSPRLQRGGADGVGPDSFDRFVAGAHRRRGEVPTFRPSRLGTVNAPQ